MINSLPTQKAGRFETILIIYTPSSAIAKIMDFANRGNDMPMHPAAAGYEKVLSLLEGDTRYDDELKKQLEKNAREGLRRLKSR